MMTWLFFGLAGVLIVAAAILREIQLGHHGSVGRSRLSRLLTTAIALATIGAAAGTVNRFIELALS